MQLLNTFTRTEISVACLNKFDVSTLVHRESAYREFMHRVHNHRGIDSLEHVD